MRGSRPPSILHLLFVTRHIQTKPRSYHRAIRNVGVQTHVLCICRATSNPPSRFLTCASLSLSMWLHTVSNRFLTIYIMPPCAQLSYLELPFFVCQYQYEGTWLITLLNWELDDNGRTTNSRQRCSIWYPRHNRGGKTCSVSRSVLIS